MRYTVTKDIVQGRIPGTRQRNVLFMAGDVITGVLDKAYVYGEMQEGVYAYPTVNEAVFDGKPVFVPKMALMVTDEGNKEAAQEAMAGAVVYEGSNTIPLFNDDEKQKAIDAVTNTINAIEKDAKNNAIPFVMKHKRELLFAGLIALGLVVVFSE
mgnify:CR=1 FL=1